MRALRLAVPGPIDDAGLRLSEVPAPALPAEAGRPNVLLRVLACAVCRTDLHLVEGELPAHQLPVTPGHQVVATVAATAPGCTEVKPGDRVGVPWLYVTCGRCRFCRAGLENLCDQAQFTGWDVDGGYAEYLLAHAGFVVPLPATLAAEAAAPLLCAGVIGYRSLKQADLVPGERLGLFGFGASAHLALQVARHWGCQVAVFTRAAAHRKLAESLGAAWVGSSDNQPDWPLDRAVIFAPAGPLVPLALARLRKGGTLAVNAIHMSLIPEFHYTLLYGERTVRSVANATRQDAIEFMRLAAVLPLHATVETMPLAEANRALQRLKRSEIQGAAVLVP
ncbi:MAG: zinc-dependent alcohol dehydrogenase family protein [Anaerolineales bacterium]|nr:zinc-dependent alcohol dehydrogenase family protein [Anaerolineales bacterium]